MKLWRQPFRAIKQGKKTIELRLYDEKRRKIRVGDVLRFDLADGDESLTAEVIKLHVFPSFKQLYERLPLNKCGYDDVSAAKWTDMEAYYSKEAQAAFGVVGIEIRLINET